MLYGLLVVTVMIIMIGIIGIFLPSQRVERRQSILNASTETIYTILINNEDWMYRSDLQNLIIIERDGDHEIWDEISKNGKVIRFHTKEKVPYSFYSFEMQSNLFTGYWTAELQALTNGKTQITATEYVMMRNPFLKTLSYLFFDLGKYMETYQKDLQQKAEQR